MLIGLAPLVRPQTSLDSMMDEFLHLLSGNWYVGYKLAMRASDCSPSRGRVCDRDIR
jgi:hypothetical protein